MDRPIALVTGSSRGIGRAIALQLATDGFAVIVNYHSDETSAGEVRDRIRKGGGEADVAQFDVSRRSEVVDAVDMVGMGVGEQDRIDMRNPLAQSLLAQAKRHYPDSVALSTIEDQVKEQRDRLMNSLVSLYKRYFKAKKLVKTANGEDLTTVMPLLKRVDPKHYLLKDKALSDLYLSEAEKLIAKRKYKEASNYIVTGLKMFPEDNRLQSLNKQINAQFQD